MKENNNVSPKIFVGQTLYLEKHGHIEEVTVSKIGNKYFYLDTLSFANRPINKYTLEYTDKNYYECNFKVYTNKQEILDKREVASLYKKIQKDFSQFHNNNKLTLEQLRKIVEIIGL